MKIDTKTKIIILVSALLIAIISRLNIDSYLKSVTIPFLILLVSYLILLKDDIKNKSAYYLLIPIFLILISNLIIKVDEINLVLNIFALIILIPMFILFLINKKMNINLKSPLMVFKVFPKKLFSNLNYIEFKKESKNKNIILSIIIGSVIGAVILALLASADDYFGSFLGRIFSLFRFDFNSVLIFNASFVILFSVFINILSNKKMENSDIKINNHSKESLIIVLSIINSVFVLFLISEISRLTVNFLRLPVEYTYSSYAREGFFQLLFITVITFLVIMYTIYKTNLKDNSIIKKLLLLLIAFSILLVFNSYYRMGLYIQNYFLTPLRLQVILFLSLQLILFICLIKKLLGTFKKDILVYFIIIISFYILNVYICNNTFINLISLYLN